MQATFLARLAVAAILASVIGLERRLRYKAAGLRTHTIVGLAAALVMIVSEHGFGEALQAGRIVLDPSRVAAQAVSGIGFLGAGVIFVRRDSVRGLTTAAGIWLCAAIGLACGAGMQIPAVMATFLYIILLPIYSRIERRWFSNPPNDDEIEIVCQDSAEVLSQMAGALRAAGLRIETIAFDRAATSSTTVTYRLLIHGGRQNGRVAIALRDVPGVLQVDPREPEE